MRMDLQFFGGRGSSGGNAKEKAVATAAGNAKSSKPKPRYSDNATFLTPTTSLGGRLFSSRKAVENLIEKVDNGRFEVYDSNSKEILFTDSRDGTTWKTRLTKYSHGVKTSKAVKAW